MSSISGEDHTVLPASELDQPGQYILVIKVKGGGITHTISGATSGTGLHLGGRFLERGHQATTLTCSPTNLQESEENLPVVQEDGTVQRVQATVRDARAVISTLRSSQTNHAWTEL